MGVAENEAEAVQWYRKAAGQGEARAQTALGLQYQHGWGVAKNEAEAVQWFQKAAEQGDPSAQTNLGLMYEDGKGVVENFTKAVQWFQKAAEQGDPGGQNNLGVMYMASGWGAAARAKQGQGVTPDDAKAVQWYRKAAEQGNDAALLNLATMYKRGWGVPRNEAEAVQWYRKAAEQGSDEALLNLGFMYKDGRGVAQSVAEAEKWFQKYRMRRLLRSDFLIDILDTDRSLLRMRANMDFVNFSYPYTLDPPPVLPTPAPQPRRALVIGNAAYPDSPLTNPVNDATDIAAILRRLGFEVALHKNADRPAMEKAVDVFTRDVPKSSAGLFFYAGHGVQIEGVNYLVPIGARFSVASDVQYHAVAADWVLARMHKSGMEVKLLLLDACRDNPLGRSGTRTLTRGLAVMQSPKGALIAYATSPGETALDGKGRNSPFTVQLLRELGSPGRDIESTLKEVRAGVHTITQGQQIPWVASSIVGNFYLAQ